MSTHITNSLVSIGEFQYRTRCRFCDQPNLARVTDLGYVPLAGGFLRNSDEFALEKYYPLHIMFCEKCYLLQSTTVISGEKLFSSYFYFSSAIKTLVEHFTNYAVSLRHMFF